MRRKLIAFAVSSLFMSMFTLSGCNKPDDSGPVKKGTTQFTPGKGMTPEMLQKINANRSHNAAPATSTAPSTPSSGGKTANRS